MEEERKINNLWDSIFKKYMADKATAMSFIQQNVPETMLSLCDMSTFAPLPSDFIDDVVSVEYRADVVYTVQTYKDNNGAEGRVIFLLEHQSTFDPGMSWRVLHYTINLMNACRRQNGILPGVISMMLYHGKTRLKDSQSWLSLIQHEGLRNLMREQFLNPLFQVDIVARSDEEIIAYQQAAPMELLFKYGRSTPEEMLTVLLPLLFNGSCTEERRREIFRDVSRIFEFDGVQELIKYTKLIRNEYEVDMIDAITRLEMENKAEGIQEMVATLIKSGVSEDIVMKSANLTLDRLKLDKLDKMRTTDNTKL